MHALLQALLVHRLLPHGFTNRDLRALVAPLLGAPTEDITAGKMTYDLRRLRAHGLITRIPHSRRYQITDPDPPARSRLRAADRAYQHAFDELAHYAHLAA